MRFERARRYLAVAMSVLVAVGPMLQPIASVAQTPTAEQLRTFQSLPQAQRDAILQQMGAGGARGGAVAGGTATDIKAIQVIIAGTDFADQAITETLPAFTVDTAGTVAGTKAFKTVTSITLPAHDGVGATTAIGFGEVLGLPYKLAGNTVIQAVFGGVKEATAPTVAVSSTVLAANTVDLNTALDGAHSVDVYLMV
jgi:hypothetical protein